MMTIKNLPVFTTAMAGLAAVLFYSNPVQAQAPNQNPASTPKPETESKQTKPEDQLRPFQFAGGSVVQFAEQIKQTYGIDLLTGTIRYDTRIAVESIYVPPMRVAKAEFIVAVQLYNQVSEEMNFILGKWIIKRDPAEAIPNVIVFVSPAQLNPRAEPLFAVRAFSLRGINPKDQASLLDEIRQAQANLMNTMSSGEFGAVSLEQVRGRTQFNQSSEILLAQGGKVFCDMVGELTDIYRERAKVNEARTNTITVMGCVQKPGLLQIPSDHKWTLYEAIGAAGGFTDFANKKRIELTSEGQKKILNFDTLQKTNDLEQTYIKPGDRIVVPSRMLNF